MLTSLGSSHPRHALGVHRGLGDVFPLRRHLVMMPHLCERNFPAAESERGEKAVEHKFSFRPVRCPCRAAIPLSVDSHAEGISSRFFPLQAACSFFPSHLFLLSFYGFGKDGRREGTQQGIQSESGSLSIGRPMALSSAFFAAQRLYNSSSGIVAFAFSSSWLAAL